MQQFSSCICTGASQDGRTPSISQSSTEAQAALIQRAYNEFGVDLASTRCFEAHGIGTRLGSISLDFYDSMHACNRKLTRLGDPIEADAIQRAFSKYRSDAEPLYVGSVKSNIGHLEAASGLAGLSKTVLVLKKGLVPPLALLESVNAMISIKYWHLESPKTPRPWSAEGLRRASMNSFGFGGANAHVILDDALNYLQDRNLTGYHHTTMTATTAQLMIQSNEYNTNSHNDKDQDAEKPTVLLVWSASDEAGTIRLATAYKEHLASPNERFPAIYLSDLAYTLSSKRTYFPGRRS